MPIRSLQRTRGLILALFLVPTSNGCGSEPETPVQRHVDEHTPPTTSSDPQKQDNPAKVDWMNLTLKPGEHRYRSGGSLCCAKGEGEECCEGFDGPGDCFRHGGIKGRCLQEGEGTDFKFHCIHCCEGLSRSSEVVRKNGICTEVGTPSWQTCFRCGDGVCSAFENSCTCPNDCQEG